MCLSSGHMQQVPAGIATERAQWAMTCQLELWSLCFRAVPEHLVSLIHILEHRTGDQMTREMLV